MRKLIALCCGLLLSLAAHAERKEVFNGIDIHYNVVNTTFLQPDIAASVNITRSKQLGMLLVSPVKDGAGKAAEKITGQVKNLLGQSTALEFQLVKEGKTALYYLATFKKDSREQLVFTVDLTFEGGKQHTLKFTQEVFPD